MRIDKSGTDRTVDKPVRVIFIPFAVLLPLQLQIKGGSKYGIRLLGGYVRRRVQCFQRFRVNIGSLEADNPAVCPVDADICNTKP